MNREVLNFNRPFSRFRVFECGRTFSCVKQFPVKTTMAEATSRCHCSVPHCSNNKQRQPYLSFHAFPSFEYDTNKWVHAIRRDQSPSFMILRGSTFVCSRHFTDADYTLLPVENVSEKGPFRPDFFGTTGEKHHESRCTKELELDTDLTLVPSFPLTMIKKTTATSFLR